MPKAKGPHMPSPMALVRSEVWDESLGTLHPHPYLTLAAVDSKPPHHGRTPGGGHCCCPGYE